MAAENNKRYISEAWIDNKEEEEFKKSFLISLIEQIQHHNNGFDADTVDGFHWSKDLDTTTPPYIKDYIDESVKYCLTSFKIGNTFFSRYNNVTSYYLGFEGIKLYNEEQIEPDTDVEISEDDKVYPWERTDKEEYLTSNEDLPTLTSAFIKLYNLTYFGEDGKTNKDVYNAFKEEIYGICDDFSEIANILKDKIYKVGDRYFLDSDSTNGIRFFIYTPEEYADLKAHANLHDPESNPPDEYKEEYDKFHRINNIFIIRSEDEIKAGGYPEGKYPHNPDIAVINKFYRFRVDPIPRDFYDEETDETIQVKWLQYAYDSNAIEPTPEANLFWRDICPVKDFIEYNEVEKLLLDILNTNENYILNKEAVFKAIKSIRQNCWASDTIPLIKEIRDNTIKGAYYNTEDEEVPVPIENKNGFNYLNLNGLKDYLKQKVSTVENKLESWKTDINNEISRLEGLINSNTTIINQIKGNSESTLPTIDNDIAGLKGRISTIEEFVAGSGWKDYAKENPNSDFVKEAKPHVLYIHEHTKLCYIKVSFDMKVSGKWTNAFSKSLPTKVQPIWTTYLNCDKLNTLIRINDNDSDVGYRGRMQYYTSKNVSSSNSVKVLVEGLFIYNG